jgi:hypothetical protein
LFNNLIKKAIGVTTRKNITPITKGETIFPKNIPNLNHNLLSGVSILEFFKPKIKNIREINKNEYLILPAFINGYKKINRKTTKKTIPKLLFELILISLILMFC